jgi:Flp pilus assembly protein TadB
VDDGSTTGSAAETMPSSDDGSGDAPAAADAAATQRSREADDRAAAAHMRHPRNRSGLGANIFVVLFVDVVVATILPMLACFLDCGLACLLACLLMMMVLSQRLDDDEHRKTVHWFVVSLLDDRWQTVIGTVPPAAKMCILDSPRKVKHRR